MSEKLNDARNQTELSFDASGNGRPGSEVAHLRAAVRAIIDHLEAQEAAKPPATVEWRAGDLVRWERGEENALFIVKASSTGEVVDLDGELRAVCGATLNHYPAAECTLIKREGE